MKKGLLPSAPAGASIDGIVRKKLTRDFYLLPFRLSYLRDSDPHGGDNRSIAEFTCALFASEENCYTEILHELDSPCVLQ